MSKKINLDALVDAIDMIYDRKKTTIKPIAEERGLPYYCCPLCYLTLPDAGDRCPVHNAKAIVRYNKPITHQTRGILFND